MSKLKEGRDEPILDPDLVIVDTHHHLFNRPNLRYLFDDCLEDVYAGHKVLATVFVEAGAMWRADGPAWLRPVGEVEFANGMAAMSASGGFGPCRIAAAIVGHADLRLGDAVAQTLDRMLAVAPERLRGIRQIAMAHPDERVMGFLGNRPPPDLLKHPGFAAGLRQLTQRGLSFDATVLHHQLAELGAVAAAHPDTRIVLDHMGLATAMFQDAEGRAEVFRRWSESLRELARRPNVSCKIGGLGTVYWDFGFDRRTGPTGYLELAAAWRPYVETAIEAFGVERCMMESDFPPDGRSCGFVPLWNAMKHITRDATAAEKAALFHATAARIYRIEWPADAPLR
jgi:predicted TIM-barrel fold metal-dependent hydrolase